MDKRRKRVLGSFVLVTPLILISPLTEVEVEVEVGSLGTDVPSLGLITQ